ncbi:MAG TPA: hypothetical protein VGQ83_43305 [Polyangia bacterium]|jgi:hypothetical protein
MRRLLVPALAAALAGPPAGCSWAFVRPAPARRTAAPLACTTARDAPIADASGAAFLWASTAYLLTCFGDRCRSTAGWAAVGLTAALGLPAALSAGYGFSHVRGCREAHAVRERWLLAGQDPLAGALGHPCRAPDAPPCAAGLDCRAERCVPPAATGGEGQPCLRLPGTAVEMCRAGLRCADGRCVRLAP